MAMTSRTASTLCSIRGRTHSLLSASTSANTARSRSCPRFSNACPHALFHSTAPTTLGQRRIVIRNRPCTPLSSSSSAIGVTQPCSKHAYSHLATATAPTTPPPQLSARQHAALNPLHSHNPPHSSHTPASAASLPKTTTATTKTTTAAAAAVSPQSSPLYRMNNPASIVKAPQARRRSPQHFYQNRILDPYVNQAVNPITLRQLVFFGRNMQEDKLLKSANYVRTELPVRLAHRIRDFQNLPFIVGTNPHIELVYDLYWQAFDRLRQVKEIQTLEENDAFCELVKDLLSDHLVVIPQLALGIMESAKHIDGAQVDQFMNKMLRSRISRRVLAEQHLSLTTNFNSPNHMMADRGFIGIIYTHCNPKDIVERTALLAAETCRLAAPGKEPPKVILDGAMDAEFSYIPDHIEYILYELLKNSMRFVMENGKVDPKTGQLPPIQITVCEGTHDIVFRISDKGGGIHPDMESHLWSYSQSPARFANFEKISKMAATVQEQMVSPSRSVNAGGQDDIPHESDEGIVLPPPPSARSKINDSGYLHGTSFSASNESTLLLDRHAPSRSHQKSAASSSYSTLSHKHENVTVIDPSLQPCPSKKEGHLDIPIESRQQDQSMHLGIGLPMSRVYAEYWGGDLKVFTMHGYGTDAYAKFCKFGNIYENFDV
ncbi:hypothetical protein EMPS_10748 [Entomortierella parvispora]|uniref:Protein-serine/threonine kinase n=1 Tax=Entomortierella parvispora TaxID=205924 RepID=A0A9P3HKH4_9FUNG|nr:hypothetical protein EMPS_10748 [Entomortierella parvispora]